VKTFLAIVLLAAAQPSTVTLDVKDEEIVPVLKSMQKQCGIKNLIIDKEVQGKGTFIFRELPCERAFDVVFRTMSLRAKVYSNDVVNVSPRSKQ
jgi:type II secretory pathway component GspD/PulD (secretin)